MFCHFILWAGVHIWVKSSWTNILSSGSIYCNWILWCWKQMQLYWAGQAHLANPLIRDIDINISTGPNFGRWEVAEKWQYTKWHFFHYSWSELAIRHQIQSTMYIPRLLPGLSESICSILFAVHCLLHPFCKWYRTLIEDGTLRPSSYKVDNWCRRWLWDMSQNRNFLLL